MPNPTVMIDGKEVLHQEAVRDYVCDACYGELTSTWKDGGWAIVCMTNPMHHGFIKRTSALYREREEELRGRESRPAE